MRAAVLVGAGLLIALATSSTGCGAASMLACNLSTPLAKDLQHFNPANLGGLVRDAAAAARAYQGDHSNLASDAAQVQSAVTKLQSATPAAAAQDAAVLKTDLLKLVTDLGTDCSSNNG